MRFLSWLVLLEIPLHNAFHMQVVQQSLKAEQRQAAQVKEEVVQQTVGGNRQAAGAAAEEEDVSADEMVFMQDSLASKMPDLQAVQPIAKSAWELVVEDLVEKRFGDNSSSSRGLRALLSEAKDAQMSIADWQRLAYAMASVTSGGAAKTLGPSHAFPARYVAGRSHAGAEEGKAQGPAFESFETFEAAWNEWTMLCILWLCLIMLASVIVANRRTKPGKISLLLELETRWRMTGSSDTDSGLLLRQAAKAAEAQAQEHPSFGEDLSVWDGTVAVFSCIVGTGLLAMPYAFSLAGMVAVPLILFFVACSAYTGHLMFSAMQAEGARQCIPSGSRAARQITLDWGQLVNAAFGPRAKAAVELFLIVELWGYLLSSIVCSAMNITQLFDRISIFPAVGLSVIGAYGLTFVPTKTLTKVNVMSNLVFLACGLMFIVTGLMLPSKAPAAEVEMVKPHGLLAACGVLVFSPAGHSFFPRVIQQMEEPSKFPTCMKRAYLAAAMVYIAVAVPGYYLFGNATQPSVLANIGVDLKLAPIPNFGWMNTAAALGMVMKLVPNQVLVLSPLSAVIKGVLKTRLSESSADAVQVAVLPTVLLVSALMAAHFAKEMALLMNLLGSCFCMNLAFVLPVICYWRLAPEPLSMCRQFLSVALVAMGLSFAVLGVVSCL